MNDYYVTQRVCQLKLAIVVMAALQYGIDVDATVMDVHRAIKANGRDAAMRNLQTELDDLYAATARTDDDGQEGG